MPAEISPQKSGTEVVSPVAAQPVPLANCKTCGKPFVRTAPNNTICPACKPEAKAYARSRTKKHRDKQKAQAAKTFAMPTCDTEVSKKEVREILATRGLRNARVIEVCIELAEVAARNLRIPFNAHLLTKGVQATLAAREKKEFTPPESMTADVWSPGERIREHELYAIWDFSTSWRTQPDGSQLSFEDWKAYRRRCITDVVWFGNRVLGKDFQPEPHGVWARDLFPQLEPALISLPEQFGQKDIAKAFTLLSDVRQRCLIAARSSFKSTFSTIFTLALVLAFAGSVRVLVCTATQPLAKGFARSFRGMLTVRDPNNPSLLNQLWPEHCIAPDEGKSLEYTSPFRQLDALIEPTLMATSVISEGQAGMRYDLAVMDDCAEISNSSTPETRAKTQERIDMLRELGEPHSLTNYVGTPISPGRGTDDDPGDLYSVLLRREERNRASGGDPKLLYTICPAWSLKPGVSKKAWDPTLTENDVDLLFPTRLTFRYLMGKLKECLATDSTAKIFRQQSLVSWVPDDESEVTVTFSEAVLRSRIRHRGFFDATCLPGTPVYLSLDRSWSTAATADFSAICVTRVQQVVEEGRSTTALVLMDMKLGRWKESQLITQICEEIKTYSPSAWVLEKDKGHEELVLGVRKKCQIENLIVPHVVLRTISNEAKSKAIKIKQLEAPVVDGRAWIFSAGWNDALIAHAIRFDGIKKSGSSDGSKDDSLDAWALAYSCWGPRPAMEVVDPEEEKKRREEEEEQGRREREHHFRNAMFSGTGYLQLPPPPTVHAPTWRQHARGQRGEEQPEPESEPPRPADPRDAVFSYKRSVQPSSDRNTLFGKRGKWR